MDQEIESVVVHNDDLTLNRRTLLKGGAALAAATAFTTLASAPASATAASQRNNRLSADYGPLNPTKDLVTGLELLALPEGFSYMSYGWTGQIMSDGRPTPTDHDGMAVVAKQGNVISMVRNHELSAGEGPQSLVEGGMYNPAEFGGTTNLLFDLKQKKFIEDYTSLGGTIRNCAGGLTTWKSWISCEETFHPWNDREDGFNHGYIFDVPGFGISDGVPIRSAGRFSHEATAVDPATGWVYETEDARPSGLYCYRNPAGNSGLADGGELYVLAVKGQPDADMSVSFDDRTIFDVEWIKVEDPEGVEGLPFESAPGAARFSRLEGAWYRPTAGGLIYFVSTDGGDEGLGQIYALQPSTNKMAMVYQSRDASVLDGPDNIAITRRGGLLLCEDGDSDPKRLIGLDDSGAIFEFARNNVELTEGDIDVIDGIYPGTKANFWDEPIGNYTSREWAGATFYEDWLFANIQSPGITFAITGPWSKGSLK